MTYLRVNVIAIILNILTGITLITFGTWLTINKVRFFIKDGRDSLGGNSSLLITGIGCIIIGVVLICQHF